MLTEIKNYLIKTYNPLIIIIHGSFANNSYDDLSDIDVLCFADVQEEIFDSNIIENHPLDCLIKPLNELNKPENDVEVFNQYDELLKENKNTEKLKKLYDNLIFKSFNKMNS